MVAEAALGDPFLDWVVLLTNNITDFYSQWPMNESDLQTMVVDKYGNAEAPHHYETKEVLYNGVVFIKEGIEVNSTFRAVMPDGTTKGESDSLYAVSNYEHEFRLPYTYDGLNIIASWQISCHIMIIS